MKRIFLFLITILPLYVLSQEKVDIECVYINKYKKEEIEFKLKNQKFKEEGLSHELMIDYSRDSYFFTLKLDSKKKIFDSCEIVERVKLDNYRNVEFFLFPPFNDFITNTYKLEDLKTEFSTNCDYFYIPSDTLHLYQIIMYPKFRTGV